MNETERVRFPGTLLEQMLQQARAAPGVEVCGLIAAHCGRAVRCTAIRNIATEPRRYFNMDPRQQIDAFRRMREQDEELFGIYHSHPDGPAEPSATDLAEAGYPQALQIIISLQNDTAPEVRAFRFRDGLALPVELDLQPPTA